MDFLAISVLESHVQDEERKRLIVLLNQFPACFHLLKGKATQQMMLLGTDFCNFVALIPPESALTAASAREAEWENLTELFSTYKKKVTRDIDLASQLNEK